MIRTTLPPEGDVELEFHRLWNSSGPDWDSWKDSYMNEVVQYLLGARGLKIPYCWEWIIPDLG